MEETLKNRAAAGSSGPEKDLPPDAEELRAAMVAPEKRYLLEIEETPERIGPYLALAEIYKHSGRLKEAEEVLLKGIKANPDDDYLKGAYAEVQISRLHQAIELYKRKVVKEPHDPDHPIKLTKLRAKLYDYELNEARRKVNAEPESLKLRLLYGMKLAEGSKHDEAIAEFQQVRNDQLLRVQALLQMGLSFYATNIIKLAERTFLDALRVAEESDTSVRNELNYNLGRIAEDQGNKSVAEEYYNEVAAQDYTYRDVAQRLRKLGEKPPEPED